MGRVCAINNIMQSIVRKIKVWNILFLNFLVTVNLFSDVQEKKQVDDIVDVNENDIQHVRDCLEKYFKNIKTAEIEFYCKSIKDGGKKFFTGILLCLSESCGMIAEAEHRDFLVLREFSAIRRRGNP